MPDNGGNMGAVLAEYNTLRQEILGYQRDSMSILALAGVLAAFSFGYAVHTQEGLFFFILTLLLVAPLLLLQRLRSTYRIGRYIQTFLEGPETGLHYETRWIRFKRKYPWHESFYAFKFAVTMPVMLLQCASTFFMVYFFEYGMLLLIGLCIISIGLLIFEVCLVAESDHVEDILARLREIRDKERQARNPD